MRRKEENVASSPAGLYEPIATDPRVVQPTTCSCHHRSTPGEAPNLAEGSGRDGECHRVLSGTCLVRHFVSIKTSSNRVYRVLVWPSSTAGILLLAFLGVGK